MSRTIYVEHEIDVDDLLGDIDDKNLLLECKHRGFSLKEIIEAIGHPSVLDIMKIELVVDNLDKKTLNELEEFFK